MSGVGATADVVRALLFITDGLAAPEGLITANRAAGLAAENQAVKDLAASGYTIPGRRIAVLTSSGPRVIDILAQNAKGVIGAFEVTSGGAVRSAAQAAKDRKMAQN